MVAFDVCVCVSLCTARINAWPSFDFDLKQAIVSQSKSEILNDTFTGLLYCERKIQQKTTPNRKSTISAIQPDGKEISTVRMKWLNNWVHIAHTHRHTQRPFEMGDIFERTIG